ncbi:MAG: MFS transporter [Proteobacteria bacterium]|nr:MFS transporter [Pseudomonadota bacterium]
MEQDANNHDPSALMGMSPMTRRQVAAVAVTVALCALDGYDVLAVTFAAPGLAAEWGIGKAALGGVFASGLAGMALGSLLLAPLADLAGRRPSIFLSLVLIIAGMFASADAGSATALAGWRFVTGLGIGAMIAVINPLAAEYANSRRRDLAVSLMAVGYPIGGVAGGAVAAALLARYDWRSVFHLGAGLGLIFVPIVWRWLPESPVFLLRRRSSSLARVNAALISLGKAPLARLPRIDEGTKAAGIVGVFAPAMRGRAARMIAIYFLHVLTVYFLLSWMPQMVADRGFTASEAAGVSVYANLAGIAGGIALGAAADRVPLKRLVLTALLGTAFMCAIFGAVAADLAVLRLGGAMAGFSSSRAWSASMPLLRAPFRRAFAQAVQAW